MIGFRFHETMRGSYYLLAAPTEERAIEFSIAVESSGLRAFAKTREARIRGEVTVEGFAEATLLDGTLGFHLEENRLRYEFTFRNHEGGVMRVRGQKDLWWLSPFLSVSTLPITLYDAEEREIGRGVVRFDLRADTTKLLKSFRLRLAT